jgi:predicted dehydrogenase
MQDFSWGVVIIGLGWGKLLAEVAARRDDAKLIAVVDLDKEKVERLGQELRTRAFVDYQEALAQPGVNTVLVAVPPEGHKALALECIDRGFHVYVEKPVGHERKPEEVMEIAEHAKAAKVRFMPGYSQRFAPYAQEALRRPLRRARRRSLRRYPQAVLLRTRVDRRARLGHP